MLPVSVLPTGNIGACGGCHLVEGGILQASKREKYLHLCFNIMIMFFIKVFHLLLRTFILSFCSSVYKALSALFF